jgi:hypothetical protein
MAYSTVQNQHLKDQLNVKQGTLSLLRFSFDFPLSFVSFRRGVSEAAI